MALKLGGGIKYEGKEPNFSRDQFKTLQEMFNFPATRLPDIFHAMNLEDGCMWFFNKANESDPVTKKWRKFEGGGSSSSPSESSEGCTYTIGEDEQLNININNISKITKDKAKEGITFADFMSILNYATSAVSLSTSSKTLYEAAVDSLDSIDFSIFKLNKSFPITELYLYNGTTKISENIVDESSYTYTPETPITTTTSFVVIAKQENGEEIKSNTITINFRYPSYYGVVDSIDEESIALPEGLTKKIMTSKSFDWYATGTNKIFVYAYPASYGNITKILDANNFDVTYFFKKAEVLVGEEVYNMYYSSDTSTLDNSLIKFT